MTLFVTQPQLRGLKVYRRINPLVWLTAVTSNRLQPADDEFRRNVQDLSDYRGIGAVAWGKHISGNGGKQDLGKISANQRDLGKPAPRSQRQDLSKPAPSQRAIAYNRIAQDIFGSNSSEDTIQRGPMQISSPIPQSASNPSPPPRREANYIEASAEEEVIMSEEAAEPGFIRRQ
jgi:hypothetical protein